MLFSHVFLKFAFSKVKENKNEPEYLIGIATIQTQEPSQSMVSDLPENSGSNDLESL
jgi:hypothetical protein